MSVVNRTLGLGEDSTLGNSWVKRTFLPRETHVSAPDVGL